jgi:hypothetical protein
MKLIRADFLTARREALMERERLIGIAADERSIGGMVSDNTVNELAVVNATIVAIRHYLKSTRGQGV